jgi:hypothetical protein
MSKVVMSVDTETYDCSITVNGTAVDNVQGLHFMKYKDYEGNYKVGVDIYAYTQDDNGVKTFTTIVAKDSLAGREAIKAGAVPDKPLPGFVIKDSQSEIHRQIAAYFTKKKA